MSLNNKVAKTSLAYPLARTSRRFFKKFSGGRSCRNGESSIYRFASWFLSVGIRAEITSNRKPRRAGPTVGLGPVVHFTEDSSPAPVLVNFEDEMENQPKVASRRVERRVGLSSAKRISAASFPQFARLRTEPVPCIVLFVVSLPTAVRPHFLR